MLLSDYLRELIAGRLGGDESRFEELWQLVPGFSERLRSFDSGREWLHWRPKTFDGWYCVHDGSEYLVYYQERGIRGNPLRFQSEARAVTYAVDAAVLPLAAARDSMQADAASRQGRS